MVTVKITTDKKHRKITLPACKEDITLEQYQTIMRDWDGEDHIKLFSILSGLPVAGIITSTDYELEDALLNCVRFVYEKGLDFSETLPQFLNFEKSSLVVPHNIGRLSIGQAIKARQAIAERCEVGNRDLKQSISIVTAIYMQPIWNGKDFSYEDALELEKELLKMPAHKVYPIGFFLLTQLNRSGRRLPSVLKKWITRTTLSAGRLPNKQELKR